MPHPSNELLTQKLRYFLDQLHERIKENLIELDKLTVVLDIDQELSAATLQRAQTERDFLTEENQRLFAHRTLLEDCMQRLSGGNPTAVEIFKEYLRLTVRGILKMDREHPFFMDVNFYKGMLVYFEVREDFERCADIRDKIERLENNLPLTG